jgi:hypothetical protein
MQVGPVFNEATMMPREGFTNILVRGSLHSTLKERAKGQEISIGKYIQRLIEYETNTAHNRAATGSNPVRPMILIKNHEMGGF